MQRTLSLLLVLAATMFAVGCDDDDDAGTRSVQIVFDARIGNQSVSCGNTYVGVGAMNNQIRLRDLRFFVSEVRLLSSQGLAVPVTLDEDGLWQGQGVALLDFEDGSADCSDSGNPNVNFAIRGTVPDDREYNGIEFTLGIPDDLNHQDSATAPPPFNIPSMWWNWRGGYKFIRIDVETDQAAPNNVWNAHLGSTGCTSPSPQDPPSSPCTRPNRPTYSFGVFDPEADTVVLDLGMMYNTVDLTADTMGTPSGCMSNPAEPNDCDQLFSNLGLDFATGGAAPTGFNSQVTFYID